MSGPGEVAVLTMGGTIDKVYSLAGEMEIGPPAAAQILALVGLGSISVAVASSKDSLDLTDDDRDELLGRIVTLGTAGVVVTHGTDTLVETAEHLARHAAELARRTVVLTGAVQPAAMSVSDAPFNLGAAVMAAQTLPAGVYVVMNGQAFAAGTVVKDRRTGRFVTTTA